MDKNRKCPICGGEFEEGFIIDQGQLGTPLSSKAQWSDNNMDNSLEIIMNRCKSCGYLESYAK